MSTRGTQIRHAAGARRYWLIWFAVVPVAAWALLRLLGIDNGFPLAALMAFTPYAAVGAFLVLGVAAALSNWAATAVATLATLSLVAAVLPRAVGNDLVAVEGRETLRVLAANVHHGSADPDALVALVDRLHPDVLSVEELTPRFARKLAAAGLGSRLPNEVLETHRSASGAGLYSRLPLRQLPGPRRVFFRSPRARLRLPDGRAIRIVGVHPFPPEPHHTTEWEEALASLPSTGRGAPWVLAGDFNGTFDQSQFRGVVDRGYRDAGATAGDGLEPTFPREGHLIPPVTIDHILADSRLGIAEYAVEELPESDHRAVYAELVLP
ncbi:MAG: endonuclease/exonuclease/phosphatase family protein [Solirubrobacterales bacterium]